MSEAAVAEPVVETPSKTSDLNAFADAFNKAAASQAPVEQKPVVAEVAKPSEAAKQEVVVEKPKSLLSGFDAAAKKPELPAEPKQDESASSPKDDKETNLVNIRKRMEAAENEREQLKARLKELETKPVVPPDYEQIKADRDLLATEMKKYKLEVTPEFKRKYDDRLNRSTSEIQKVITSNTDIPALDFLDLVKAPESKDRLKKIDEQLDGVPEIVKSRIMAAVTDYDRVRDERASELANPDEQLVKLSQQEEQERLKFQQEQANLIHSVLQETEAEPEMAWFKENPDAAPEWNAALKQVKQTAVDLWQKPLPAKTQAKMAVAASMAPLLYNLLQARTKESTEEIGRLNEELAKFRKGTPAMGAAKSGDGKPALTGEAKRKEDLGAFENSFKSKLRGE